LYIQFYVLLAGASWVRSRWQRNSFHVKWWWCKLWWPSGFQHRYHLSVFEIAI